MSHKQEAPMADICLLLEGTWPYVRGGVSIWIHQMILGLPELTGEELVCERESCEEALAKAKTLIKDMPIILDYLYHPRPLGLAKLLLTHGFCVKAVYLDGISFFQE